MIKVVEAVKPPTPRSYPCLLVGSYGLIVLFKKCECGTVLQNGSQSARAVGEYHTDWIMDAFKPYTGSLTLSNQE